MNINYLCLSVEDFDYDNLSQDATLYFVDGFGVLEIDSITDCFMFLKYDNCCNDEQLIIPKDAVKYKPPSLTDNLREDLISGKTAFPMEFGASLAAKYDVWKENNG